MSKSPEVHFRLVTFGILSRGIKSKHRDRSRLASDSARISGRRFIDTWNALSKRDAGPKLLPHCSYAVSTNRPAAPDRSRHVAFLAGREAREFRVSCEHRPATGRVPFPQCQNSSFTWPNDARLTCTVRPAPVSVTEPAATVVPPHHGKHWPPDWKKKTTFLPEMAAISWFVRSGRTPPRKRRGQEAGPNW